MILVHADTRIFMVKEFTQRFEMVYNKEKIER